VSWVEVSRAALQMQGPLLLSIVCLLAPPNAAWAAEPELPTKVHVAEGLAAEVEILVDRWGVPHLRPEP
jgi:acyl-homoserine lactone acylase PvdQ